MNKHINNIKTVTTQLPHTWLVTLKKNTKRNEDDLIRIKLGKFRRDIENCNFDRVFNSYSSPSNTAPVPLMFCHTFPRVIPQCACGPPPPQSNHKHFFKPTPTGKIVFSVPPLNPSVSGENLVTFKSNTDVNIQASQPPGLLPVSTSPHSRLNVSYHQFYYIQFSFHYPI